ncbi:syntaxin 1B/2/3 [Trypanosoma conorhini]|uniref:Syntaxin 1B/2/3 n=1 Tax=Trypanosoma conorhini TaxID=83891 RepID=A0A3R7NCC4_9TRYP|nr:syntaxin 1B/2/3 [Trypanosoma conorhini]RNF19966.1 syntaxin 1B/2/3 [Trypanosoma conorhini]
MNRTEALRELFDKGSPYIEDCESFVVLDALRAHPFYSAFVVVGANAEGAVRVTRSRINAALRAMEECNPAMADLEGSLLMQEAELLSASNTIKDLSSSIGEAQQQLEKKEQDVWSPFFFSTGEGTKERKVHSASSAKPTLQFLQHLGAALDVLEGTVGRWRLRLALCKEELALYKREMFTFGRVGVLSCSNPEKEREREEEIPFLGGEKNRGDVDATNPTCSPHLEGKPYSPAGVVSVVDLVIKKAARTVTAAPLPHGEQLWSLVAGGRGEASFRMSSLPEAAYPQFAYNAEEVQRLTEANIVLQEQQKMASAEDAKAVEASVRELSQLTSLMNEQVMQQNEQFSILLRNTEMAHNNMHKGVTEVRKTLSGFWNPTRQLILCLWVSILVLLLANWCIR